MFAFSGFKEAKSFAYSNFCNKKLQRHYHEPQGWVQAAEKMQ